MGGFGGPDVHWRLLVSEKQQWALKTQKTWNAHARRIFPFCPFWAAVEMCNMAESVKDNPSVPIPQDKHRAVKPIWHSEIVELQHHIMRLGPKRLWWYVVCQECEESGLWANADMADSVHSNLLFMRKQTHRKMAGRVRSIRGKALQKTLKRWHEGALDDMAYQQKQRLTYTRKARLARLRWD